MQDKNQPNDYIRAVLNVFQEEVPGALDGLTVYTPADLERAVRQAVKKIQDRQQIYLDVLNREAAERTEHIRRLNATIVWLQDSLGAKTQGKNQL